MPAKLTLKVFQEKAAEREGRCLSTEYIDSQKKLEFECKVGHRWKAMGNNVRNMNQWCPDCASDAKRSLEDFQKKAAERGGRCLSTEYIGIHEKLEFECSEGHTWKATGNHVLNKDHWCPKCALVAKRNSIGVFQKIAAKRGGRCLSTQYFNKDDALVFECAVGHVWQASGGSVKNTGSWCPHCAGMARLSIEEFQEMAGKHGGRCLSTEYLGVKGDLVFECAEGHVWSVNAGSIRNRKSWCPNCSAGRGEKEALTFASTASKLSFEKTRPQWLRSPKRRKMEIDGYCERAGLAIEYQGLQHYEYIPEFFHRNGPEDFERQLERDRLKAELIARHNILLLAVPASKVPDPASVRAAVVKAAEDACFPLLGVNREFTRMCVEMGRPPIHRFSACLPYAAFRACCGE